MEARELQSYILCRIKLYELHQKIMDKVFGQGACSVLKIRKYGGMKVL